MPPAYVTMLRHPAETLASARKSYGTWQTAASRAAAWINVSLETEHATRGERRAFVRYEDLLADWRSQIGPLGERLGPAAPALDRPGPRCAGRRASSIPGCTATAWAGRTSTPRPGPRPRHGRGRRGRSCSRSAAPDGDTPALHQALDAAHDAFRTLYAEAEAIAQSSVTAAKKRAASERDRRAPPPTLRVRIARRVPKRYRKRRPPRAAPAARIALLGSAPCRRISVVVPVYNVEPYLEDCLESLAAQTFDDLEVVMVNDGSTDRSPAIAEAFAARDPRFKLVHQPNGGLSKARNTGTDVATGEFLAFVDSDDVVAPDAYELLLGALDETGSDFASGNVHRLTSRGTSQARFLTRAFAETRLKTHVTKHRDLLADRTAWNKLWRRSFWDAHGLPLPRGPDVRGHPRRHPAALRGQVRRRARRTSSTTGAPARARISRSPSAAPSRARSRTACKAIEEVHDYLAQHGQRKAKQWYDASVVADDLQVLPQRPRERQRRVPALFLDRVNAFLDGVEPARLPRAPGRSSGSSGTSCGGGCCPSCSRSGASSARTCATRRRCGCAARGTPTTRTATDRSLRIPRRLFRVNKELEFSPGLSAVRWEDGRLRLEGWAFVAGVGAAAEDSQRVTVTALPPGRLRSVRLRAARLTGIRLRTAPAPLPEPPPGTGAEVSDIGWAGFTATLDARRLRSAGRWRDQRWDVYIAVRVGRVWRRRAVFRVDPARPLRATEHAVDGGAQITAAPTETGGLTLAVRTHWATLRERALDGDAVALSGEVRAGRRDGLRLEAAPARRQRAPQAPARGGRRRRVHRAHPDRGAGRGARTRSGRSPCGAAVSGCRSRSPRREAEWVRDGREVALTRAIEGDAVLALRTPRRDRAARELGRGRRGSSSRATSAARPGPHELVLVGRESLEHHAFPVTERRRGAVLRRHAAGAASTRWPARCRCARTSGSCACEPPATTPPRPRSCSPTSSTTSCRSQTVADHKPLRLGMEPGGEAVLFVGRDLDPDERGRRQQRRLRATVYAAGARDAAARRRRLHELRRPPVLGQPARDPRGARAPRAAAGAPVGRAGRPLPRAGDRPRRAREQPRALRGDGTGALRGRQRPLPQVVPAPGRTRPACRPGTARR